MSKTVIAPPKNAAIYEASRYSPAVAASGLLFISGQVGVDASGAPVKDPEAQTRQAFENLKNVLESAGRSFADLVEVTSYHVDLHAHAETVLKVKDDYIEAPYPAWTAIGVQALWFPELILELRVIATAA